MTTKPVDKPKFNRDANIPRLDWTPKTKEDAQRIRIHDDLIWILPLADYWKFFYSPEIDCYVEWTDGELRRAIKHMRENAMTPACGMTWEDSKCRDEYQRHQLALLDDLEKLLWKADEK